MKDVLNPYRVFITKEFSSIFLFHLSAEGFIRMSASIVTVWGFSQEDRCLIFPAFITVWNRSMQRYYEMDVNQTQHVQLKPSVFKNEINSGFAPDWWSSTHCRRESGLCLPEHTIHNVKLHQNKHWAGRKVVQQLRSLCWSPFSLKHALCDNCSTCFV